MLTIDASAFRAVAVCAADGPGHRFATNLVQIEPEGRIVGTDGHRLLYAEPRAGQSAYEGDAPARTDHDYNTGEDTEVPATRADRLKAPILVDAKSIDALVKAASKDRHKPFLWVTPEECDGKPDVTFRRIGSSLTIRKPDGVWPPYEAAIPPKDRKGDAVAWVSPTLLGEMLVALARAGCSCVRLSVPTATAQAPIRLDSRSDSFVYVGAVSPTTADDDPDPAPEEPAEDPANAMSEEEGEDVSESEPDEAEEGSDVPSCDHGVPVYDFCADCDSALDPRGSS